MEDSRQWPESLDPLKCNIEESLLTEWGGDSTVTKAVVHVEEGPDDDDDDDGGVDDDVDADDSWSFSCWGSLICKQSCKQTAG